MRGDALCDDGAASYPFGRPADEQLKREQQMHLMLQVPSLLGLMPPCPILL